MTQYKTNHRSTAKTRGYLSNLIRDAIADGSQLKLIEMERKGFVTYNCKNGTYTLTDEGKQFLAGGRQ